MYGPIRRDETAAKQRCRMFRKTAAARFRSDYVYYDHVSDHKTCIFAGGDYLWNGMSEGAYSWHDKSAGIIWLGVHGKNTICVVTMARDVNLDRVMWGPCHLRGCTQDAVLHHFRKLAISEIEGQREQKSIPVPFSVVSVTPQRTNEADKESGHEASSDDFVEKRVLNFLLKKFESIEPPAEYNEKRAKLFLERRNNLASELKESIEASSTFAVYDEKKAIEFLQEELKSNVDFTVDHTIQTAIAAFQQLLQKQFKANEIEVSYLDPDFEITGWGHLFDTSDLLDLEIDEIEMHLAAINGPSTPREVAESSKARANVPKVEDVKDKKASALPSKKRKASALSV